MISRTIAETRGFDVPDGLGHLGRWPGYALFFLMLFVPTAYRPIKGALLAITLAFIGLDVLRRGRIALHPQIVTGTLIFATIGLFFTLRGVLNGAPGALRMSTVYVIWPLVYMLLVAGASQPDTLRTLFRLLMWSTVAISLYSLHYVLWAIGWWPDVLYLPLDQGQAIGVYDDYLEFGLYSISTLLFLVPFSLSTLLVVAGTPDDAVRRRTVWMALGLGLLTTLLAGRRALLVVIGLTPLIAIAFWACLPHIARRITRKMVRRTAMGGLMLGLVLMVYLDRAHGLTLAGLLRMVGTGFQFGTDPIAQLRTEQFEALIAGWQEHPWLGTGHGASAAVIRSDEQPWAYELSYVALLFHTGLVGLVLYAGGVGWIVWMGLRMVRAGQALGRLILPILVGTSTFLIANATNPYLEKYDFLWVLFLPVAFVNCWLLSDNRRRASRTLEEREPYDTR